MFYSIYITQNTASRPVRLLYGYYQSLDAAKEALVKWSDSILKMHPDKKVLSDNPAKGRRKEDGIASIAIGDGREKSFQAAICEEHFEDETGEGFIQRNCRLKTEAIAFIKKAVGKGNRIKIPYYDYDDDRSDDNVTISVYGRHGSFSFGVKSVSIDEKDRILLTGVDEEDTESYDTPEAWDVDDNDWPYLADVVADIVNDKEKEQ